MLYICLWNIYCEVQNFLLVFCVKRTIGILDLSIHDTAARLFISVGFSKISYRISFATLRNSYLFTPRRRMTWFFHFFKNLDLIKGIYEIFTPISLLCHIGHFLTEFRKRTRMSSLTIFSKLVLEVIVSAIRQEN